MELFKIFKHRMFGIVKKPDYAILATYVVDSKFAKITHVLEHLQTF